MLDIFEDLTVEQLKTAATKDIAKVIIGVMKYTFSEIMSLGKEKKLGQGARAPCIKCFILQNEYVQNLSALNAFLHCAKKSSRSFRSLSGV